MKTINVISLVSQRTHEPLVEINVPDPRVLLPVSAVREIARTLLEAAEAAQTDAFLFAYLTKDDEFTAGQAVAVIADFRSYREVQLRAEIDIPEIEKGQDSDGC